MNNLRPKGKCRKCGGRMYIDKDHNGWYEHCLQCGAVSDLLEVTEGGIKRLINFEPDSEGELMST